MPRITNNQVRAYVEDKSQFLTNNETMMGSWFGEVYATHSYGHHFPMYVYDAGTNTWFGNEDKYSRTTSAHQSKARPRGVDIEWCCTDYLRDMIRAGSYAELCARRLERAVA